MSHSETQESGAGQQPSTPDLSTSSANGVDEIVVEIEDASGADEPNAVNANSGNSTRTPLVEILPPEADDIDPDRFANMAVNRTQISLGLTGVSFKRTQMSGGSGQYADGPVSDSPVSDSPVSDSKEPNEPDQDAAAGAPTAQSGNLDALNSDASNSDASNPADSAQDGSVLNSTTQPGGDESDFENVQLLSQFLVGLATFGVDELMARIRYFDDEITENPAEYDLDKEIDKAEEDIETIFRYWVIGTLLWGERTALSASYRTFQKSLDVGGLVLRIADRTTDNFLLRPARRRFERLGIGLRQDAAARIDEGRTVQRRGRVLAEQTLDEIVGDVIDYMSENPELIDLISDSGMGLASNVMDNGRQIGAVTDTAVENLIRRIFRRPSRQELPPSPFDGKPQTMYDPINQIQSR